MMRKRHEPTWSVLTALVCLLVLSALAPHAWDRVVSSRIGLASPLSGGEGLLKERTTEPSPRGLEPPPCLPDWRSIGYRTAWLGCGERPRFILGGQGTTAQAADEAPIVPEIDGVRADSADIPGVRESVATPPSVLPMGDNRLPSLSPPAEIQAPIETLVPEEPAPIEKPLQPLPSVEPSRPVLSEPASPVLEQSKPALEPSKPSTPAPSDPLPSRPTSSHGPLSKPVSSDPVPQTSRAADEVAEDRRDEPDALMDCLEELMWECETGEWAMEVCRTARRAMREVEEGSDEATATLGQLKQLADQAASLAGSLSDDLLASQVRRAEYALGRRWMCGSRPSTSAAHRSGGKTCGGQPGSIGRLRGQGGSGDLHHGRGVMRGRSTSR